MRTLTRPLGVAGLLLAGAVVAADPHAGNPVPPAASKPTNGDAVRRRLGVYPDYPTVPRIGAVKVAVLDSGFDRVDGKRPYLPASAVVVEHYDADFVRRNNLGDPAFQKPFAPGYAHGRLMAQLVWATTGSSPHGPKFYLLNANGPTLFRRAVRYAVEQKVDVILFCGTFEGAGNYDGRGPINAAVDEAVGAGVIWVNAAGNSGGLVYNGPVGVGADGYLNLRSGSDPTALRLANRLDENPVTVTLTWNDYRDAEDAGTDKDLDLVVEDWLGRVAGASRLKQVPAGRDAGPGESKNPRERVVLADLPASAANQDYRIRVKANSANFGPRDRVRVLVTAARSVASIDPDTGKAFLPVEFLDATAKSEVYPPADHPGVLTVGDASPSSAVGPTADGRAKPDVVLADSVARFSNGDESAGSSNAAAYFAGVAAVLRATEPGVTTGHVREWVRRLDEKGAERGGVRAAEPAVLSPNEQRALKYSAAALEQKRRMGDPRGEVLVSAPGGTYVVRAGGTPAKPAAVEAVRPGLVHAPWTTPAPKALADLVRGSW